MTRSRDMADAGAIINYLDDVSSDVQTQIASVDVDRYSSNTISTNTTIESNTHYKSGKSLVINNGITFTVPVNSLLDILLYTTGKAL